MLGSREAAEDVTQEVFVALARGGARFDATIGSLTTYLYGVARHVVYRHTRRRRAHAEVDIAGVVIEDAAPSANPAAELSRKESVGQLRRAILRLPVHYREAIVLCELNSVSYEEAARIVGCPVGTIRSRLSRARALLIERCRATLRRGANSEGVDDLKSKGRGRWLIPTKNNC
jgi:RNA polymerase sigma-70 factor (ECF subfamily)